MHLLNNNKWAYTYICEKKNLMNQRNFIRITKKVHYFLLKHKSPTSKIMSPMMIFNKNTKVMNQYSIPPTKEITKFLKAMHFDAISSISKISLSSDKTSTIPHENFLELQGSLKYSSYE